MNNFIHISMDFDWIPGSEKSVPRLFDLFRKYDLKPSLFFTGNFAQAYPEIVIEALRLGYEIGTHGVAHGWDMDENFGVTTSDAIQHDLIARCTDVITKITSRQPVLFRAPLLNISTHTYEIISEHGYVIDSSVPARRFDFGAGSVNSLKSFAKPSKPYFISTKNGRVLEVPPSASILPLNMRMLRTFTYQFMRWFCSLMAKINCPLVFYMHPAEFVHLHDLKLPKGFYKGFYRNCGPHNFLALERFLLLMKAWEVRSEYMAKTFDMAQENLICRNNN